MRRVDLHCYPGTDVWVASQGPYAAALGAYLLYALIRPEKF